MIRCLIAISLTMATSAFSHVLLETESQSNKYFYYRSGEFMYRYVCPYNSLNPSPSSCTIAPEAKKIAKNVYEQMEQAITKNLPELETRRSDLLLFLTSIDRRIDDVSSTDVTPSHDAMREAASKDLDRARETSDEAFEKMIRLQNEVDSIEIRLRETYDEDLMQQSLIAKRSLLNVQVTLQNSLLEVEKKRTRYIDVCSQSQENGLLNALRNQRKEKSDTYIAVVGAIKIIQNDMAQVQFFVNDFVEDRTLTYDLPYRVLGNDAYPFRKAYEIIKAFERAPRIDLRD
jgi:hypothetical protein